MENKDIETLKAEIERFKTESLKTHVVKVWAESYTNSDPFGYAILEKENNKVWWMKTQAHQLWEMWQAAKLQATPEGFVLVRKELPEEIAESMALERVEKPVTETDPTWIKISEDAYKGRIQSKKWELWRDYKAMIEAQEQSHD